MILITKNTLESKKNYFSAALRIRIDLKTLQSGFGGPKITIRIYNTIFTLYLTNVMKNLVVETKEWIG